MVLWITTMVVSPHHTTLAVCDFILNNSTSVPFQSCCL
jgi:outer membrane lipopolysaccharide assembly protein LptE/RlpB